MADFLHAEFRDFVAESFSGLLRVLSAALRDPIRLVDPEAGYTQPAGGCAVPILLAGQPADLPLGTLVTAARGPEVRGLLELLATEMARQYERERACERIAGNLGEIQQEIDLLERYTCDRRPVYDLAAEARRLLLEGADVFQESRLFACLKLETKLEWLTPGDEDPPPFIATDDPCAQVDGILSRLAEAGADVALPEGPTLEEEHASGGRAVRLAFAAWTDGQKLIGFVGLANLGGQTAFEPVELDLLRSLAGELSHAAESHQLFRDLRDMLFNTVRSLVAAIEAKDEHARGHSERVHRLSLGIARELGLSMPERRRLSWAALLHDVGKIATPEEILGKRGDLTPDEEEQLKEHPIKGCDLLAPIPQLHAILPAIRNHHERFDGRGYPDGLRGERIPLLARIIAVAEAFDAGISTPPWQRSLRPEEAIDRIAAEAGKRFDPEIVHALQRFLAAHADESGPDEIEDTLGPPDADWDDPGRSMAA